MPGPLDPATSEQLHGLLSQCMTQLKREARRLLSRENRAHTYTPTDLVHHAFLQLFRGNPPEVVPESFVPLMVCRMARDLIEYAQARKTLKRGGNSLRQPLEDYLDGRGESFIAGLECCDQIECLLGREHATVARLLLFAELTPAEIAALLCLPQETIDAQVEAIGSLLRLLLKERKKS